MPKNRKSGRAKQNFKRSNSKILLFIIIVLGAILLVFFIRNKEQTQHVTAIPLEGGGSTRCKVTGSNRTMCYPDGTCGGWKTEVCPNGTIKSSWRATAGSDSCRGCYPIRPR